MKKLLYFIFICSIFDVNLVSAKTITFKDEELCQTVYREATWDGTNQADVIHNNCSSSKSVVFDRNDDFNLFDSITISKKYLSLNGLEIFPNLNEIFIYMEDDFNMFDFNDLSILKSHINNLEITCTNECSIANFKKIVEFINISDLELHNVNTDLSYIGNLNGLNKLKIYDTNITDPTFISNLTQLKELSLVNTNISNINFLKNLSSIEKLYLKGNNIRDISVLENLNSLNNIYISEECDVILADGEKLSIDGNKCSKNETVIENNDIDENREFSNKNIVIVSIIILIAISVVIISIRKNKKCDLKI